MITNQYNVHITYQNWMKYNRKILLIVKFWVVNVELKYWFCVEKFIVIKSRTFLDMKGNVSFVLNYSLHSYKFWIFNKHVVSFTKHEMGQNLLYVSRWFIPCCKPSLYLNTMLKGNSSYREAFQYKWFLNHTSNFQNLFQLIIF